MSTYDKYLQKVNQQSVDYLKQQNLNNRLIYDYNSEEIEYNNNLYKVIIQSKKIANNESCYKISAPKQYELHAGDVVFWKRVNSHYMIFTERITEKSYFIGDLYEARYLITYLDSFNNKHSQYGVVKSINDTIRDENITNIPVVAELINGDMVLYLTKTENTKYLLKRNKMLKIGNRNWKIVGWDDLTYNNIIMFSLVEALKFNEDADNIPYPEIDYSTANIITNLDSLGVVKLNSSLPLNIQTIFKDEKVDETYSVVCENCDYVNNIITFNTLNTAIITIIGNITHVKKEYTINITSGEQNVFVLKVSGRSLIKQSVPYSYKITLYNNGVPVPEDVFNSDTYQVVFEKNTADVKIKRVDNSNFFLKIENIGKYIVKIKVTNITTLENITKEIIIESEDIIS